MLAAISTLDYSPRDGGHIYTETNFNHLIVEPYNALSALLFFAIAMYWFYQLKGQYEQYKFLSWATALLGVGAVGGIIYHAFRIHAFFMYMDWLPILMLCLMASIYFLEKILGTWYYALGVVAIALGLSVFTFTMVEDHNVINLNYAIFGTLVLLPTLLILIKHRFFQWWWIGYALGGFGVALFFRIADKWGIFPMGTHFLWHLFGAVACNSMFLFIYRLNRKEYGIVES